jgi:hypothetical protein
VVDQAALYGLLRKVRDVGLPLLSVVRVIPGQTDAPDAKQYIEKMKTLEMTTRTAETSPLLRARVAGFLYLSLVPLSIFGILYGGPSRLGIASALLGVPIAMLNELNQFAVLFLSSGADSLRVFTPGQLHALASLFLNLHNDGITIAGLFWGLWLFPMGYLVFESGFLPRILGILLMIGCAGYLIQSFAALLLPNLDVNIALVTFWGEVLFPLWLVIKGVNVEQWEKRAHESA